MKTVERIIQNSITLILTAIIVSRIMYDKEILLNRPPEITPIAMKMPEIPPLKNGLININTANLHQLWSLKGIGEPVARAIIAYREEHGDFKSVDDLVNVSGIGVNSLKRIRKLLTV